MNKQELFIGLMSGTSADSIDAALVAFDNGSCQLLGTHNHPLPINLKSEIHALTFPGDNEIARLGVLDNKLGHVFADAVTALLAEVGKSARDVAAIGSHGQTIRHEPAHEGGVRFTLQIGDANIIAERTNILTVADFRRRDIACGGHGAPLAPAFHAGQFGCDKPRCIVNVGGIANMTSLSTQGAVQGFDTGPGNTLLDAWIQRTRGKSYDKDGAWAASASVDDALLHNLLQHPFLKRIPPKSTGREEFNLLWLEQVLGRCTHDIEPASVQATLLEFTALTVANAVRSYGEEKSEVFICGGGAHNLQLMRRLRFHLPNQTVDTTDVLGLHPDWVEAAAFAWLAKQHLHGLPGNLPSVTGANKAVMLGAAFPP